MRKKIEYYSGYGITRKVLKRIALIDSIRIQEHITDFSLTEIRTLRELCEINETKPRQEYIILGEDWYISYTKISDMEIKINDWVAINNTENKFTQTMEMISALKQILIENDYCDIYALLRHSTSYGFYQKFIETGYFEEGYDFIDIDEDNPRIEQIKHQIFDEYDSIENYLKDEFRNRYEEVHLEDYIYHEVCFNITEKFKNRYKKSGRK